MRFEGNLKSWNDDRGFGFIQPAQGGREVFVHIKAFPGGSGRPSVGQALTFEVEDGSDGRKRAHSVQYRGRAGSPGPQLGKWMAPWSIPRLGILPAFAGVWFYVASQWPVSPLVLRLYAILSLVTFVAYAIDKWAAIRGHWRTTESTLHVLGLAGGWPGALLAQQFLRHKSSKPSFVAVFWITVALNIAAFVGWHSGLVGRFFELPAP